MSRQQSQQVAVWVITAVAVLVILPIIFVILFVIVNGLSGISWEFLSQPPRSGMTEGGIFPAVLGTVFLTLGTAVAAIPLGIGAAIYLAEYAGDNRLTRAIRLAIVNLAGIPSIVYGLFGLGAFVLFLNFGTSILAGSLTLGLMTLPVVISTAEEAIWPCRKNSASSVSAWARPAGRPSAIRFCLTPCPASSPASSSV